MLQKEQVSKKLLCEDNRKDIEEIKKEYISDLTFHYVETMMDVLKVALTIQKVKEPIDLTVKEKEGKTV